MNDLGLGVVVSMKDAFSRNAQRIQSSMHSLDSSVAAASERMTRNLDRIRKGTMTIGAGLAALAVPAALVVSTAATQKALGELASLGVRDLRAIEDAAESFTNQWAGTSKAEFVAATYDVKSALSNLSDEAVGVFTATAALTAKATKASTQEMVGAFTTGYGIFKPLMSDMTDMEWAEAFSGAMAHTVASFKTNGQQMADAIKNIGAVAASANVPLQEQLAVLGQLQTTMPGAQAGTLYKAFMMKAAEAGKELGLAFTDSTGRLRSVPEILREIQGLYPDLSKAAAQVELKKAFGSDEALKFVLQMSSGMEALEANIDSVGRAMKKGTATTEEMARTMNLDIGARMLLLRQQVSNLFEILGRTLLPAVARLTDGLSRMIVFFQKVARDIPGATRAALVFAAALGAVLVVAGGVMAAVGLIGVATPAISAGIAAIGTAAAGAGAALAAGFLPATLAIAGVVAAVVVLRRIWTSNFGGIRDAAMDVWNRVSLVFQGIKALVTSLGGGMGRMSADLADKLEAAGLLGFVVTVFKVYYRVREFLGGLVEAFSQSFGRVRAILEPAVRSLVGAFAGLGKALVSVFEVFGLMSTAADGSSFRALGKTVGAVLGVLLQVGAYAIRFALMPLTLVVKTLAVVVVAAVGVGKAIVDSLVMAGKFIAKFLLPVRMLGQAFVSVGKIVGAVWGMLTGDVSFVEGLKTIGGAVFDFLATPFRWARDAVAGVGEFIRNAFSGVGEFFVSAAARIGEAILDMPIVATLLRLFGVARDFLSGDTTFLEAGKRLIMTLGEGIVSMATYPYRMVKDVLGKVRNLLPFSDAREGPLSTLAMSGAALLRTFAQGMTGAADLPGRVFADAVAGLSPALASVGGALRDRAQSVMSMVASPLKGLRSLWNGIADGMQPPTVPALEVPDATGSQPDVGVAAAASVLPEGNDAPNLAPTLDARLVPAAFSAVLLLTPVLVGSLPVPPITSVPVAASVSAVAPGFSPAPLAEVAFPDVSERAFSIVPPVPPEMETTIRPRLLAPPSLPSMDGEIGKVALPDMPERAFPIAPPVPPRPETTIRASLPALSSPPVMDAEIRATPSLGVLPAIGPAVEEGARASSGPPLSTNMPFPENAFAPFDPANFPIPEIASMPFGPPNAMSGMANPALPDDETLAPVAPFPGPLSPRPDRIEAYQRNDAPDERPASASNAPPNESQTGGSQREEGIRPLLEALVAKMEALAERPIEVSVASILDGRKIAEAVYKDMREQRIRNYETL